MTKTPGVLVYARTILPTVFPSAAALSRTWCSLAAGMNSNHSANAETLTYIVNECERKGQPYRLTAQPGLGYYLEFLDEVGHPIKRDPHA